MKGAAAILVVGAVGVAVGGAVYFLTRKPAPTYPNRPPVSSTGTQGGTGGKLPGGAFGQFLGAVPALTQGFANVYGAVSSGNSSTS